MVKLAASNGCESWTIKKAEHGRLELSICGVGEDSRVSWTARSDQSILREINLEYIYWKD